MSRNMRAIKTQWSEHAGVRSDIEAMEAMLVEIWGKEEGFCSKSIEDMQSFWFEDGVQFLKLLESYSTRKAKVLTKNMSLDNEGIRDMMDCLDNLKAMTDIWSNFINDDGSLEIQVDAY